MLIEREQARATGKFESSIFPPESMAKRLRESVGKVACSAGKSKFGMNAISLEQFESSMFL